MALESILIHERRERRPKEQGIQSQARKLGCSLDTGKRMRGQVPASRAKTIQGSPGHTTHLKDHSGLLQQVGPHVGSNDVVPSVKANLDVLPEAAAVVIASGFGISDGLFRTNQQKLCKAGRALWMSGPHVCGGTSSLTEPLCHRDDNGSHQNKTELRFSAPFVPQEGR